MEDVALAEESKITQGLDMSDYLISPQVLSVSFRGVAVATKTPDELVQSFYRWISSQAWLSLGSSEIPPETVPNAQPALSVNSWRKAITAEIERPELRHLVLLAIGISLMRSKARDQIMVTPEELEIVWSMISEAMNSLEGTNGPAFTAARSAQGFLAVPLCSLLEDGNIEELWRFHVWLPDGARPTEGWGIHSHQAFAQSWILAGKGEDFRYSVDAAARPEATHAKFSLAWTDATGSDKNYKTHQTSSTVANTGNLVYTVQTERTSHTRDTTYTVPAASFHATKVDADAMHATLFVFDASRGFVQDAPVLGSLDEQSSTQTREVQGTTPAMLATMTTRLRALEALMIEGGEYIQRTELEYALRSLDMALHMCETAPEFPAAARYRREILAILGGLHRRFGRYDTAKGVMEEILQGLDPRSPQHMETSGELSVVDRHMDQLEDAKRAAESQYETASYLGDEINVCRAAGTIGMINYQLFLQHGDSELLDLAMDQLRERVLLARRIKEASDSLYDSSAEGRAKRRTHLTREIIGLQRLALCYTARGETKEAIKISSQALKLNEELADSTVLALSCFFYGRALLRDGQREAAMEQFNPSSGCCTPAIALCKEPSDENCGYLEELVQAGANFDQIDEHGYTALDYAVFNGNEWMIERIKEAFRLSLQGSNVEADIDRRYREAQLRKGYREVFQEELRPVLLKGSNDEHTLQDLRLRYSAALAKSPERSAMFDGVKYMRFDDFLSFGRLPRSNDTLPGSTTLLARRFGEVASQDGREETDFIIFFSYRWINQSTSSRNTPDDSNHILYNRMIRAIGSFLEIHPLVNRDRLGIWLDHVCVDQDDPLPGISALPMIIAQCNALISLVDDLYYSRAWCSIEVLIASTLRDSYGIHMFYEHLQEPNSDLETLRKGPVNLDLAMANKNLTFEEDRATIMFLARQSKLLG